MDEVLELLKKVRTFYLATVEGDQPRVRPMGAIHVFDGKMYTASGRSKDMSKQMFVNPKVEMCAFDAETGTWLRVTCKLVEETSAEAKKSMFDSHPNLGQMYDIEGEEFLLLRFDDAVARFDSFGGEPTYIKF